MLQDILLIVGGLVLLTIGAEGLVRGASAIATRLGVSSFIIGLTIVGFGTSTPELAASVQAALKGADAIAVGNVIGSNIFNIAVIVGLTALVCGIPVEVRAVRAEIGWMVAVAFTPLIALLAAGRVTPLMGGALLAGLLVFTVRGYLVGRRKPDAPEAAMETEIAALAVPKGPARWFDRTPASITFVVLGLAGLVGGAALLVDGAVGIALSLEMSELVIGLTIVAAGTSMPELATSLVAALRKKPELALGNVLGSNVFNALGILGAASMFSPQHVTRQSFLLDTPVMIGVSVLLAVMCATDRRISRAEGALLLTIFLVYLGALLFWAPGYFMASA